MLNELQAAVVQRLNGLQRQVDEIRAQVAGPSETNRRLMQLVEIDSNEAWQMWWHAHEVALSSQTKGASGFATKESLDAVH